MGKKGLHLLNIFPRKIMIAYFLGLLLILLASSLVITVGFSQISSFDYAITGGSTPEVKAFGSGTMITEQNVKTVYNSQVPVTIADAMNSIHSLSGKLIAYPLTLTPVTVNGSVPLVIRGLPNNVIEIQGLSDYQFTNTNSNLILLGSKAETRLGAHLGERVLVSSPFTHPSLNLTVSGFFNTGTEEDYEAVVSLTVGRQIAGLAGGIANAVIIPSSISFNLNTLAHDYQLNVQYRGPSGNLLFIDSSGYIHSSTDMRSSNNSAFIDETLALRLPFGVYTVVLERGGFRTPLGQFATVANYSTLKLNSSFVATTSFLSINTSNSSVPVVLNSSNYHFSPDYYDQSSKAWVFKLAFGTYSLLLNGSSHQVLVFGNVTYYPKTLVANSLLNLQVHELSDQPIAYVVTVKDSQSSRIVFGSFSTDQFLSIPVQSNHSYTVDLLTTEGLLIEKNVSIIQNNNSLQFDIPYLPGELESVPISDYADLGLGFPSQTASFSYFFASITASTFALFATITVLLVLTLLSFDSQFLISLRNETRSILYMFPREKLFFWKVTLPMLVISSLSAAVGIVISLVLFQLFHLDSKLTFIGYGIQAYPVIYVGSSLVLLSLLSWVRISLFFKVELFGQKEMI